MSRPTKYVKGEPFTSMDDLCAWLSSNRWVYLQHGPSIKVYHPGWIVSMQFRTVMSWVQRGGAYRALERTAIEEAAA